MKRTRIRYKKLFGVLALIVCAAALVVYASLSLVLPSPITSKMPGEGTRYCLFIGIRESTSPQADSLILTSVNSARQELYAVSIPGNTKISKEGEPLMILKDAYVEGGAEKTVSAVENLLHIRIDRYAVFDSQSFSSLIDRFGGVDLYVEQNMYHEDESQVPDIEVRQGFQTLKDGNAYGYMRYIEKEDGEIGRLQREERFLKAFFCQARRHFRLYTWGILRSNWNLPDTNISSAEVSSMAYEVLGYPEENLHVVILPGEMKKSGNTTFWYVNPVEIQKIVGLMIDQ